MQPETPDEIPPPPPPVIPAKRSSTSVSNAGSSSTGSGTPHCECRLTARIVEVKKDGPNKGKWFWSCPNSQGAQCKFFEWATEEQVAASSNSKYAPSRPKSGGGATGDTSVLQECFKASLRLFSIPLYVVTLLTIVREEWALGQ